MAATTTTTPTPPPARRVPEDSYFDACAHELLSAEQETELGRLIKAGGEAGRAAEERLIRANLRLVVQVAKRKKRRGVLMDDLIQEGNKGLLRAARGFDPERGLRFSTFAVKAIRWRIMRFICEHTGAVHVPSCAFKETFVTAEKSPLNSPVLSFNRPTRRSGKALYSLVAADGRGDGVDPFLMAKLQASLANLSPRERMVLVHRFGLGDAEERTLDEIGQEIGRTRERVRQIERQALKRLREKLERTEAA